MSKSTGKTPTTVVGKRKKMDSQVTEVSLAAVLQRTSLSASTLFADDATVRLDSRARTALEAARTACLYVWSHDGVIEALAVRANDDASALVHALLHHLHRASVMDIWHSPERAREGRVRLFRMVRAVASEDAGDSETNTGTNAPVPRTPQALLDATQIDGRPDLHDSDNARFVAEKVAAVRHAFTRVELPSIGPSTPLLQHVRAVQ